MFFFPPTQPRTRALYLQCIRTPGPRAPAHQMVVQLMLCLCHEGSEVQGISQTQVSPETPVWRHCLSYLQCAVYFTSHPPNPEPAPSTYSASAHRGRALLPIRWLFNLCCAFVMRAARSRESAKPRFPQKLQFGVTASLIYTVQYVLLPTHPTPNPRPLPTVHPHTGAARSCPSDGCSTYAVPVS